MPIVMAQRLSGMRIVLALFCALAPVAFSQEAPPLQIDARVQADGNNRVAATFERQIKPGLATVSGRIRNLPGGETALVKLHFDYNTEADFALDEIISLIVISLENSSGTEVARATIDPNDVNLNPNRVPLHYSATLYKPQHAATNGYIVRVRVYGNYE